MEFLEKLKALSLFINCLETVETIPEGAQGKILQMSVSKVTNFYLLLQTLYFAPQSIEFPIQTLCSILCTNMESVTLENFICICQSHVLSAI